MKNFLLKYWLVISLVVLSITAAWQYRQVVQQRQVRAGSGCYKEPDKGECEAIPGCKWVNDNFCVEDGKDSDLHCPAGQTITCGEATYCGTMGEGYRNWPDRLVGVCNVASGSFRFQDCWCEGGEPSPSSSPSPSPSVSPNPSA